MTEHLPESQRKEIFDALVDAQDHEMSVLHSRELVAKRFGVTDAEVREIEREGLDRQWPPL
jgi:hypothetical protein